MTTRAWWRSTGRASPSSSRCRWSVAHERASHDAWPGAGPDAGVAVAVVRGGRAEYPGAGGQPPLRSDDGAGPHRRLAVG
ncbi:hypothetical protein G6F61_014339 [Rhizopus arrhizus]|uniref:Uncharacterized protein n=1 Tax=Rhizopus delemar TaxID=936053 RepID=A0A9P7C0B6_9FUNG|nr:hypothetical protein G6F23_015430 [Rhizopus arrhizus]KAG1360508.1 hypothetical protein G6F61_014339 [Rhizopus arrhizus]KAG1530304.1 hypothetical protein G6F50_017409 [Rhizopus delemar]